MDMLYHVPDNGAYNPAELWLVFGWAALWGILIYFIVSVIRQKIIKQSLAPILGWYAVVVVVGTLAADVYVMDGPLPYFLYNAMGPKAFFVYQAIVQNYFSVIGLIT